MVPLEPARAYHNGGQAEGAKRGGAPGRRPSWAATHEVRRRVTALVGHRSLCRSGGRSPGTPRGLGERRDLANRVSEPVKESRSQRRDGDGRPPLVAERLRASVRPCPSGQHPAEYVHDAEVRTEV